MSDYAIVAANPGGPEVLQWQPRPETPRPDPFEVLVRTHAVGVNFIEIYQRSGVYPVPFPFTPGTEASGVIVAVGEQVPHLAVGDRVTTCEATATYAEHFTVRADRVVQVPESISFELAAAIPLQGLTAHYLHTSASNPKPGEWVLLHAGAGGVGLLLTQFLADKGVQAPSRSLGRHSCTFCAVMRNGCGGTVRCSKRIIADRLRSTSVTHSRLLRPAPRRRHSNLARQPARWCSPPKLEVSPSDPSTACPRACPTTSAAMRRILA